MAEPIVEIDVIFVGHTGVGKSSIINMIMGVRDDAKGAARVWNNATPCTLHTTSYPTSLETGLRCVLWDTRGLNEAADTHDRGWITKFVEFVDRIRLVTFQQERELRETLQNRTKLATPILMWCIHATKIGIASHWQHFHKVYAEYCGENAIPVIVITQTAPTVDWEQRCNDQLRELGLSGVHLSRVRRYRDASSSEYKEDSKALKDLISNLTKRE